MNETSRALLKKKCEQLHLSICIHVIGSWHVANDGFFETELHLIVEVRIIANWAVNCLVKPNHIIILYPYPTTARMC